MLKGKRAIVTGSSGFIGSMLLEELIRREGVIAIGVDKATGFDIRHPKTRDGLKHMMRGADYVFHLAVLPFNPCTADMRLCIDTNVVGTLDIVEAAAEAKVKKIIYSSASAVYGNIDAVQAVDEMQPCNPNSLYGVSKLMGELIVRNSGVPYVILRYMNVYGENQKNGLIPALLKCVRNNTPPIIDGDGKQAFDFVHVQDVVRANILAAASDTCNAILNIGGENELTVSEVVKMVLDAAGSNLTPVSSPNNSNVRRVGSSAKARKLLGYCPSVDFNTKIKEMVYEYTNKNEHTDH